MNDRLFRRWDAQKTQPPADTPAPVTPINGHRVTRYAAKALTDECDAVAGTPKGGRNHRLNVAAFSLGQLVAAGALDETEVRDALTRAGRSAGLGDSEIGATISSGLRSSADKPRALPEEADGYDVPAIRPFQPGELDDFWDARELLGHLYTYARSRRVSPWAVLGIALARTVTATAPHFVLPPIVGGIASLNLFLALVGNSGSGKGAAEAVGAEAFDVGLIETHKTGSGEGIAHSYMRREKGEVVQHTTAVLFSVPEIDTLAALGGRQGATLLPELRSAWSGERLGFAYADPGKRLPIPAHQYRLCLSAGVQPARAGALLDDTDGGTPQRFVWLPSTDTDAPDDPPGCPKPLYWPGLPKQPFSAPGGFVHLDVCQQARDLIDQARLDRLRGVGEALDGHALLCHLKVAAALALSEGRLEVTDDDWDLSAVVMRVSDATRAASVAHLQAEKEAFNRRRAEAEASRQVVVGDRLEDDAIRRACQAIVRKLRREDDWVSHRDTRVAIRSRDRAAYADEAISRLLDAGQIEVEKADGSNEDGPGRRYKLTQREA